MSNRQQDFFWGVFLGGTLATLSTLLFTTKKGKQLQSKINGFYDDVEKTVKGNFSEAKDKVEEIVDDVKDEASDLVHKKAAHKKA